MEEDVVQAIKIRTIIEVLGKPKEHVEKSIKAYINNMREDKDLSILKEDYSEITEKEKLWLGYVELEIVVRGLPKLFHFCFEYMPSSIDILKPSSFTFSEREMTGYMNDLQARLHTVDMVVKNLKSENNFIKRNMTKSVTNNIVLLLKLKKLNLEEISKLVGINKDELKEFVDGLVEENKLKKEGELYSIAEHVQN